MMSIQLILILFIASIILCWGGGELVKRRNIKIPKLILVIFHVIYIAGLVASYILL
ncbi:MAG: hypothetical protein ACFFDQ_10400 [Candidatus Thorarchaeota archaeon]